MIVPFTQSTLLPTIQRIVGLKNDAGRLIVLLGTVDIDFGNGSLLLSPLCEEVNGISFKSKENTVEYVLFRGQFNLDFSMLPGILGSFREMYNPYDDVYQYYFNEDHRLGNFSIRTISQHGLPRKSDWRVDNIEVWL